MIDRPFVAEQLALSSDGRYLAHTQHDHVGHTLFVTDLERKSRRSIPLSVGQRADRIYPRLLVLRWVGERLVMEDANGQVMAIDPTGANPATLWRRTDDGLVNGTGTYGDPPRFPTPGPPRVIPVGAGDPEHIYLESVAWRGPDRLSNLYRINVRTMDIVRTNLTAYYHPMQLALYGPPATENGLMLYDREGRPRILYGMNSRSKRRDFAYEPAGGYWGEPGVEPVALEEAIGQRTLREKSLGQVGEFDVRPETYFDGRSYPIAFDYDPDVVYLASSLGRDTYGIYSLNLKTRERRDLAPGLAGVDLAGGDPAEAEEILIFDDARRKLVGIRYQSLRPRVAWLDQELAELQVALDDLKPRHVIEIVAWDAARRRFALRVSNESDPGAIFLYHRDEKRLEQITSRAPWLASAPLKDSAPFTFETAAGVRLSGYLTLPTEAMVDPPPLLIYCAAGLWDRAAPGFNREAEMLADMGLVVMRLNYRGSAGFGRSHLKAIQEGIDTIPVADFLSAIDWLAARRPIDRKRVIVMGEGFGGYLALRAVKNHPDRFRAAISVNAPTNLSAWASPRLVPDLSAAGAAAAGPAAEDAGAEENLINPIAGGDIFVRRYDFSSLVRTEFIRQSQRSADDMEIAVAEGDFRKPVLLISNPRSGDITPLSSLLGAFGLGLEGMSVQRLSISGNFVGGTLETRSRVFRRIDEFLNVNLYNFDTEIGNLREVKPPPPSK